MKTRQVVIDPDAKEDLRYLYHWIAASGSPASALNYLQRIQDFINGLDIAAERGTTLDIVDPGLRSIPFESVVLAVRVTETTATVARVFHHSRDWMKQLQRDSET
jgi:toxin ParE1/3/4